MAPGGIPNKLSQRHALVAYLMVSGLPDTQIAERLGYTPSRISILRKSPLMRAEVARLQSEIEAQVVQDVAAWIKRETPTALRRLGELRDQDDSLPVAFSATQEILRRAAPVVEKREIENVIRVAVDATTVRRLARVLAEDDGHDPGTVLDAIPLDDAPGATPSLGDGMIRAQSLDEILDDLATDQAALAEADA